MDWGYDFDPKNLRHWCFDDCPSKELFLCWHYEYLRDCPSAVQKVRKWREKNPIEKWSGGAIKYFLRHPFERIIEEWPLIPWLEIPQEDRDQYLEIHNTVAEWSWQEFEDSIKQRPPVATFHIWAGETRSALNRRFKEWQERHWPKDESRRERRGRRTLRQDVKVWLKQLGVWRLWRRGGMSQHQLLCQVYNNQPDISKAIRFTAGRLALMDKSYH